MDPRLSRRAAEARPDGVVAEIVEPPHGEGQALADGKAADDRLKLAARTLNRFTLRASAIR